jgi:hypothetical protein
VLRWQHRTGIRERCPDLFGRISWRWRMIRTSNAHAFRNPKPQLAGVSASKSENPTGTQDQDIPDPVDAPARDLNNPLECALARFRTAIEERLLLNKSSGSAETS